MAWQLAYSDVKRFCSTHSLSISLLLSHFSISLIFHCIYTRYPQFRKCWKCMEIVIKSCKSPTSSLQDTKWNFEWVYPLSHFMLVASFFFPLFLIQFRKFTMETYYINMCIQIKWVDNNEKRIFAACKCLYALNAW